jgi:hypothetical protein
MSRVRFPPPAPVFAPAEPRTAGPRAGAKVLSSMRGLLPAAASRPRIPLALHAAYRRPSEPAGAEVEALGDVVARLGDRHRVVDADRAERRAPDQAGTDRGADHGRVAERSSLDLWIVPARVEAAELGQHRTPTPILRQPTVAKRRPCMACSGAALGKKGALRTMPRKSPPSHVGPSRRVSSSSSPTSGHAPKHMRLRPRSSGQRRCSGLGQPLPWTTRNATGFFRF